MKAWCLNTETNSFSAKSQNIKGSDDILTLDFSLKSWLVSSFNRPVLVCMLTINNPEIIPTKQRQFLWLSAAPKSILIFKKRN